MRAFFNWLPGPSNVSRPEQLRAAAGALCGLLITALFAHYLLARTGTSIFMIAPMGASAVLLFAVPASPLAQPWSVFGGNVVSGLAGTANSSTADAPIGAIMKMEVPVGANT